MRLSELKELVLRIEAAGYKPDTEVSFWLRDEVEQAVTAPGRDFSFVDCEIGDAVVLREHKVNGKNAFSFPLRLYKAPEPSSGTLGTPDAS